MTKTHRVRISGPLASFALGFREKLLANHYTPLSTGNQLRLMAHLSRWLAGKKLEPSELDSAVVARFIRARRRAGYTSLLSSRALAPLLAHLQQLGVVPTETPAPPRTATERLLVEYVYYLRTERELTESTIRYRERVAREFAGNCAFTAKDVTRFMLSKIHRQSVGTAGCLAAAVRSLLRFLYLRGDIKAPLTSAVPKIARWRLSSLPRALEPSQVERLLRALDRRTAVGRRDYAIMLLLVRLGLRRAEVANLKLDDVDWRAGEIMVRSKGGRRDPLPLPVDVGDAVVAYLRRGRPSCKTRSVFVSTRAPHQMLHPCAITELVARASIRADMGRIGAHRLRHTAATQMLRRGCSLAEIGQVLRHRHVATTAIYAKVDRDALRMLALPWPGVDA